MSNLRVGVIGLGKMGLLHGAITEALDGTELVAAADSEKLLPGFMKELKPSMTMYGDFHKMLDGADIDAAIITTPVHLHVPIAIECAKRNVHYFCEKPLSIDGESAAELLRLTRKNDVISMVGYMMRYLDTFREGKRILDSGVLGDLIMFNSSIYVGQLFKKGKGWRYDKEKSGGGVLMNQGSHLVDLLLWYFGKAKRVSGNLIHQYAGSVEDFAHGNFEFENGLKGWMDTAWSKRHHRLVDSEINIQGENGTLEVTDDEVKIFLDEARGDFDAGWSVMNKTDLYTGVPFDIGGPQYTEELIAFYKAISAGNRVESDIGSALRVQRVIDAFYLSSEENSTYVEVQYDE